MKRNGAIAAFKQKALIVGASGRMASEMIARLGFECSVADLYADRDTHQICEGRVTKLQSLSDIGGMERIVRDHDFVVFAGGLEGHASIARTISRWSKPAFTSVSSLKNLADYRILNQAMTESNVDRYPFRLDLPLNRSGRSVSKNLLHSGTARLTTEGDQKQAPQSGRVFQELVSGETVSLIFVAKDSIATCLGGTSQLFEPTNDLMWAGSIGGLFLNPHERVSANRFAHSLTILVGLTGVFGVDFIRNEEGIWPVDVNPRIPASAEVVGDNVMRKHLDSFGIECSLPAKSDHLCWGKQVVFNPSANPVIFRDEALEGLPLRYSDPCSPISIADVPKRGETIAPNHPICTVVASGNREDEVRVSLAELQKKVLSVLGIGEY